MYLASKITLKYFSRTLGTLMMCQSSLHIFLQIGLAVGDIEAVQKNARLKRLAMQVQLHTEIERKLPQRILEWVDKKEWKEYVGGRRGAISKVTN